MPEGCMQTPLNWMKSICFFLSPSLHEDQFFFIKRWHNKHLLLRTYSGRARIKKVYYYAGATGWVAPTPLI
jgi:hypothetical protein